MLDLLKPVRLSDGRKARIICTDAKGKEPILALIGEDECRVWWFTSDGATFGTHARLENITEPRIDWLNINKDKNGTLYIGGSYDSRIEADGWASIHRQHLLEINIDTGETKKHEVGT